jgi:DNA modification methylase
MAERMNNFTGKEWLQNSFTIWRDINKTSEERKLKHPAMFPEQLAERLINIYTKNPGEVILDPFLGIGSTLKAAYKLGKNGVGIDLNKEYCNTAKKRVQVIQDDLFNQDQKKLFKPKIFNDDALNITKYLKNNSVDLVVTSPPYWDILNMKRTADNKTKRNYSGSKKDIGNITSYEDFLNNLKKIYTEVYKVLKPNKRCCCVVMDIRKKDKFYPFHEDQTKIMREIGFELEEYVIWDRQKEYNNMKTLGYPYVFRFNKVHEYICIYWKRK